MQLLETFCIGEPSNEITQRPDRKTDNDVLVFQIQIVLEKRVFLTPFPDLETEIDEILFGTAYPATI